VQDAFTAPIWFFLVRKHRLAYLQVPKVACTTLRVAICLLNRPDLSPAEVRQPGAIHSHREWNDIVPPSDSAVRKCFRFTFVRHPLARFLSFYRNKIGEVRPEDTEQRFVRLGLQGGMSLAEVIERVLALPRADLDPHLVPQSHLVMDGKRPRVDFIGRLERFAEDLETVEKKAGVRLDVGSLNASVSPVAKDFRTELGEENAQRLSALYHDDFTHFGYPV
jgi:hypothetical protein